MSDQAPPARPGLPVFIRRRNGKPVPPPGAGVRFVTCHCGGQFMAMQGQVGACPRCGARGGDRA